MAQSRRFIVQMAGSPGAGKSVLALRIGRALPAVVLDKDIIKSAMLEAGVRESNAAWGSYEVLFRLADRLLEQGYSVVLDSPSYYESIPRNGLALAEKHEAEYVFVDCICSLNVIRERVRSRAPMISQAGKGTNRPSIRPHSGTIVTANTEADHDDAISTVMEALGLGSMAAAQPDVPGARDAT